jgi:hypothetical protein
MVGADPSFDETHVLRTLFILDSKRTGRKRLVKLLGVGEGSVRTIIKRLSREGLITSAKLGHSLTEKGGAYVKEKLNVMSKPRPITLSKLVSAEQSLIILRGASNKVGDGTALRDVALKAGADGAVILVDSGGVLRFPGGGLEITDYLPDKGLLQDLDIKPSDALIIGFAKSPQKAEDGAVAAALALQSNR